VVFYKTCNLWSYVVRNITEFAIFIGNQIIFFGECVETTESLVIRRGQINIDLNSVTIVGIQNRNTFSKETLL